MHHRHLRQTEHHRHRGDRGNGVAQNHGRPGVADGNAAAHEQPRADRAAQADHYELRAAQVFVEAGLATRDRGGFHGWLLGDDDISRTARRGLTQAPAPARAAGFRNR
jgi:hypothetical protein